MSNNEKPENSGSYLPPATFVRLPSETGPRWGLRVMTPVIEGDTVMVHRKNGACFPIKVGQLVASVGGIILAQTGAPVKAEDRPVLPRVPRVPRVPKVHSLTPPSTPIAKRRAAAGSQPPPVPVLQPATNQSLGDRVRAALAALAGLHHDRTK